MQIALVLYPGFTILDIIGPFQTLAEAPGHEVVFVAETAGSVADHTGKAPLVASHTFDQLTAPDIVVVPGGVASDVNPPLVAWLKTVAPSAKYVTSVCTGSIFLAAAGLLTNLPATTHWAAAERLEANGAIYTEQRVVEVGKIITAAGVSSGIDMGLVLLDRLHGSVIAQAIQLAIEYDPQPPFNAGSPSKAPKEIVDLVRSFRSMRAS